MTSLNYCGFFNTKMILVFHDQFQELGLLLSLILQEVLNLVKGKKGMIF